MATTTTFSQLISDKLPLLFPPLAALFTLVLVQTFLTRKTFAKIPTVGQALGSDKNKRQAYLADSRILYAEGYRQFKNTIYKVLTSQSATPHIVVPNKFLAELKKFPDDVLSFSQGIAESMHSKYTLLPVDNKSVPHTIKTSLTPALPRLSASLSDELQSSFLQEFPECSDWTSVNVNQKLLRVIAMLSGRIFIGPELCRDEAYLDASINYTLELMHVRRAVDAMAPWKRPFLAHRLPESKKLKERIKQANDFLHPVVEARKKLAEDEKPDDMLQWMMDAQQKMGHDTSTETLAILQLTLSFAAIHTTTMTTTNAFYNLAAFPSVLPELREEIRSVLALHDGMMTAPALQSMKKLDSFLKETLRFHPPSAVSFIRKVLKPITLSNGQSIPAGSVLEVASDAVARDAAVFPEPEKFDALRFYKLREQARERGEIEAAAQNQFVSVTQSSLTFGYGKHACPGRFLAASEIKMIVAQALLLYDIRMVDGETGRYPNLEYGGQSVPDPRRELLLKRAKV